MTVPSIKQSNTILLHKCTSVLQSHCLNASGIHALIYAAHMSPALNRSYALQQFKCGKAIEMHNRIMLDFYPGLSFSYWWPIFDAVHSLNRLMNTNLLLTSSNNTPIIIERRREYGKKVGEKEWRRVLYSHFVVHHLRTGEWWEEGKGKNRRREGGEGGGKLLYVLTFLWFTIFMSRSSLNALFAYVSFWNGFTSFLIATLSPRSVSMAELEKDEKNFHFQRRHMHEQSHTSLEKG